MGSNNDVKNDPVAKQASVTETLDTFIALKKVNQCNAIMHPASKKSKIVFLEITILIFLNLI